MAAGRPAGALLDALKEQRVVGTPDHNGAAADALEMTFETKVGIADGEELGVDRTVGGVTDRAAFADGFMFEDVRPTLRLLALPFMGLYSLFGPFTIAITWMTWAYVGSLILVLGANLMAKQVLTKHVEKMKETLWIFRTKSPS